MRIPVINWDIIEVIREAIAIQFIENVSDQIEEKLL